jgi:ribosome-associated toxin RatA of RatAB toxin-antitoxin module
MRVIFPGERRDFSDIRLGHADCIHRGSTAAFAAEIKEPMLASFSRTFRSAALVATSAALLLAPIAASADMTSDTEAQALADRSSPRFEVDLPGASLKAGGSKVLVNASMSIVRKVVQDFAHYQAFMPRFQKSRVVAKKDGKTDVYLQVPILHGAATVWALTRFEPPAKEGANGEVVSGKMVEGNVDDFRAVWHLRPVDDTHTVLRADILIVPKLPLPGSVVTPELEFAADQAVTSARDRAEAKASAASAEANANEPAKLLRPHRARAPRRDARVCVSLGAADVQHGACGDDVRRRGILLGVGVQRRGASACGFGEETLGWVLGSRSADGSRGAAGEAR